VNVGPLTAENDSGVCGTQQISTGFASWLSYCTDVAQRRSTKLCTMFGRLLGWYTMHFGGYCPLTEFYQVQNSLCFEVLRSPILVELLHGIRAGASVKLCGVVSSRDRAAIPFDIGRSNCLVSTKFIHVVTVQVSCAVRSYWQGLPIKSSYVPAVVDYFVGLKCYSVYLRMNVFFIPVTCLLAVVTSRCLLMLMLSYTGPYNWFLKTWQYIL